MKLKNYTRNLTATVNGKGVLDIDTVKGCEYGMTKYPGGGCYGLCYACKFATVYGYDFSKSAIRNKINRNQIERVLKKHRLSWFRIGTNGDPCHDWDNTVNICEWLGKFKIPVIVTKHWIKMSHDHARALMRYGVIIHTSTSPLDSDKEIDYRINTFKWLKEIGIKSILRVVSVKPGLTINGEDLKKNKAPYLRIPQLLTIH